MMAPSGVSAIKNTCLLSGSDDDFAWLKQNANQHDVSLKNLTSDHTTLALQGPKSARVLRKLTAYDIESIGYYRFVETQVANVNCIVARMGYTGEFGYELHFHPQHARKIWSDIMSAGAEVGIAPCGQAALEACVRRPVIFWSATIMITRQIRLKRALVSP